MPHPIALFVKYLEETKQIKTYRDKHGKSYVMLEDLLKYKGYMIPDTYYGYGEPTKVKYFTNVEIDSFPMQWLVDNETGQRVTSLLTMGTPWFSMDDAGLDSMPISQFLRKWTAKEEYKCDISKSCLMKWLEDSEINEVIDTIGSVEWNFFATSQRAGVLYID